MIVVSDTSPITSLAAIGQLDLLQQAIALAIELNAELLLIDERRGRAEADRLGLRITGLLGVVPPTLCLYDCVYFL